MKWQRLVLVLLLIILVGVNLTLILYPYYGNYLQEYHEVPFDFQVRNGVVGLNTNNDALHFGALTPNSWSKRFMNITPARDARLVIIFTGNGSFYVTADPNDIAVEKGRVVAVTFTAMAPANITFGNYTGVAQFYLYTR
jgi:hypothetical protein